MRTDGTHLPCLLDRPKPFFCVTTILHSYLMGVCPFLIFCNRSCDDNACISALVAHPRNPREWWVVRSDGLAGQFDFLSRRFVTCQRFSRPQKVLHDGEDELRAPTGNASAHTPAGFFHGGGHPVRWCQRLSPQCLATSEHCTVACSTPKSCFAHFLLGILRRFPP